QPGRVLAPKGRKKPAQGSALGTIATRHRSALKGCNKPWGTRLSCPFRAGTESSMQVPRALPWAAFLHPLQGKEPECPPDSGDVGTLRLYIQGVQGLARRHEQAVALGAAEADVGTDLRQQDQADPLAVRCEHVDPVVAVAHPAGPDPDVAVDVRPDAVREA